jgi:hypothetical protein
MHEIEVLAMAVRILKNLLVFAGLGLCLQVSSLADESNGKVAKLTETDGTVMVDRGKGFVTTKVNEPLFENDRVITLDDSAAEITFNDGCRIRLKANNLIEVNSNPGCKVAILDATKAAPGSGMGGSFLAFLDPASLASMAILPAVGGAGVGAAIIINSISDE